MCLSNGTTIRCKTFIDVLLEKITPQIERFNHTHVSTFESGYTHNCRQSIYRQLVAANLLTVDMSGFGSLRLTNTSMHYCVAILRLPW